MSTFECGVYLSIISHLSCSFVAASLTGVPLVSDSNPQVLQTPMNPIPVVTPQAPRPAVREGNEQQP